MERAREVLDLLLSRSSEADLLLGELAQRKACFYEPFDAVVIIPASKPDNGHAISAG